jgi:aryl-alcohol dehydrogenase-like predicted oxidoreductase
VSIVTKLPAIAGDRIDARAIAASEESLRRSLDRLRRQSVYGLLLHRPDDLVKPGRERLVEFLHGLKAAGIAAKVGISAYSRAQIDRALEVLAPDLVQVPVNVFDQRLISDGTLARLRAEGIEVHARSIFLQGALLADSRTLPAYFEPFLDRFRLLESIAKDAGLSPLTICLQFVLARAECARAIVGVTGLSELQEIVDAAGREVALPDGLAALASTDPRLVDPSTWPAVPAKAGKRA